MHSSGSSSSAYSTVSPVMTESLDGGIPLGENTVAQYHFWHCRQVSQHQKDRRKFILPDGVELELDYAPAKVCEGCYLSA